MKFALFQLVASGVALGLMCGAVAIHSLHVSGAEDLGEGGDWMQGGAERTSGIIPTALGCGPALHSQSERREEATTLHALEEILARLQELKSENQNLHGVNENLQDQLAETNRDLSELQFRVDTHSESFRPLRTSPNDIRENTIRGAIHPLLPPKDL
jgi:chromosome segregation ATPase